MQEQEGVATQLQNVVQAAVVEQDTLSRAIAQLLGALNQSISLGGTVVQANTSAAVATATTDSVVTQAAGQIQQGTDEAQQLQLAIQSATVSQTFATTAAGRPPRRAQLGDRAQGGSRPGHRRARHHDLCRHEHDDAGRRAASGRCRLAAAAGLGPVATVAQSVGLVGVAILRDTFNECTATGDPSPS